MKLAIYGDSFGCHLDGWPSRIGKFLKCEVDTYAEGGTSIDYSYYNFIKTHEGYDKVIFLWTNSIRTSLILSKNHDDFVHVAEYHAHHDKKYNRNFNNLRFKKGPNGDGKELSKGCVWQQLPNINTEKYYLSEQTLTKTTYPMFHNTLKHKAMKDSVMLHRPDCVNINCFTQKLNEKEIFGIHQIQLIDFKNLYGDNASIIKYNDDPIIRPNHLTRSQNNEFAKYAVKHITDKGFDIHDTFANPKKYYTMSVNKTDAGFVPWA